MDLQLTKLELIEMVLNSQQEAVLNKVRAVLEEEQGAYVLTDEQYKTIDERRKRHINGESASFTWAQVKEQASASK